MAVSLNPRVLLLCALPQEEAPVLARMTGVTRVLPESSAVRAHAGCLGGQDVFLVRSGEGRIQARRAIHWLDQEVPEVPLLAFGVSGAASDVLALGEMVVASKVASASVDEPVLCLTEPHNTTLDAALENTVLENALSTLGQNGRRFDRHKTTIFVTVERPLTSKEEKARARDRYQGSPDWTDTVCVDMESYPVAQACQESGRPVLLVRTISDTSKESLPSFLARCRTSEGATHIPLVVLHAALRPWSWGPLLRLSGRVNRGSEWLAIWIEEVLLGIRQ